MSNGTAQEMREKIAKSERTRHIAMWHDHSTILGRGYVLVTIKLLYDHAVFKSDDTINQSQKDLQAYIEEPEIHIIALSSSSVDDQTTLIDARLPSQSCSCLSSFFTLPSVNASTHQPSTMVI